MSENASQQAGAALDQIDAALDNLCGHCSQPIPPQSVSAYFCNDGCQQAWHHARSTRPAEVYYRQDAAPYPGGPMDWAPGLVTVDPGPDLVRPGEVPDELAYRGSRFTATVYRRISRPVWHLRLDDGHRYVGLDLVDDGALDAEAAARTWRRLERELADQSRVEPASGPRFVATPAAVHVFFDEVWHDVGYATDLAFDAGRWRTAAGPRAMFVREGDADRTSFRPAHRWCLSCGERHRAPASWPHGQCTGCRAPLPPATYTVSPDPHTPGLGLAVTIAGAQLRGEMVGDDQQVAADLFDRLEAQLVRTLRERRRSAPYTRQAPVNPNLHAQVRGATWRVPVNRHHSVPLAPESPTTGIEGARAAIEGHAEAMSRLQELQEWLRAEFRRLTGQGDRGDAPHPMAAALERVRQRQGHSGPQPRRRAPRRIDPGGGAR